LSNESRLSATPQRFKTFPFPATVLPPLPSSWVTVGEDQE
jgi:hypothetical protein